MSPWPSADTDAYTEYSNTRDIGAFISTKHGHHDFRTVKCSRTEGRSEYLRAAHVKRPTPTCADCGSPVFTSSRELKYTTPALDPFYENMADAVVRSAWEGQQRGDQHGRYVLEDIVDEMEQPWFVARLMCMVVLSLHHDGNERAEGFMQEAARAMVKSNEKLTKQKNKDTLVGDARLNTIVESDDELDLEEEGEDEVAHPRPVLPLAVREEIEGHAGGRGRKMAESTAPVAVQASPSAVTTMAESDLSDAATFYGGAVDEDKPVGIAIELNSVPATESDMATNSSEPAREHEDVVALRSLERFDTDLTLVAAASTTDDPKVRPSPVTSVHGSTMDSKMIDAILSAHADGKHKRLGESATGGNKAKHSFRRMFRA
jgi:hypothetical protein